MPGELRRVERQALLLRHLHRHRLELAQPGRAAQLAPARADAADTLVSSRAPICFISMRVWSASAEVADEVAEVEPLLGGEEEGHPAAVERALDLDQLDRQRAARGCTLERGALLLALALQVAVLAREVAGVGLLDDPVERPARRRGARAARPPCRAPGRARSRPARGRRAARMQAARGRSRRSGPPAGSGCRRPAGVGSTGARPWRGSSSGSPRSMRAQGEEHGLEGERPVGVPSEVASIVSHTASSWRSTRRGRAGAPRRRARRRPRRGLRSGGVGAERAPPEQRRGTRRRPSPGPARRRRAPAPGASAETSAARASGSAGERREHASRAAPAARRRERSARPGEPSASGDEHARALGGDARAPRGRARRRRRAADRAARCWQRERTVGRSSDARGDDAGAGPRRRAAPRASSGARSARARSVVCAVDDRDLALRHQRGQREPAGELAHLLDADVAPVLVAGDDPDIGMGAGGDARALRADAARVVRRRCRAEEPRRERVGERRLPTPAGPRRRTAPGTRASAAKRRSRAMAASWPTTSANFMARLVYRAGSRAARALTRRARPRARARCRAAAAAP